MLKSSEIIVPVKWEELISLINTKEKMKTTITLNKYDVCCGDKFEYKWRDEYSMFPEIASLNYEEREKMKNIIKKVLSSFFKEDYI